MSKTKPMSSEMSRKVAEALDVLAQMTGETGLTLELWMIDGSRGFAYWKRERALFIEDSILRLMQPADRPAPFNE